MAKTDFQPGWRGLFTGEQMNNALTNIFLNAGLSGKSGITAFAGGGQTSATQLSFGFNVVTTVATAADSVKLPRTGAGGKMIAIANTTVNALQVFGHTAATINGVAAGTGVSIPAGKNAIFWSAASGAWFMNLTA